jgi:hypothetical protein
MIVAVLLICAASVAPSQCSEATASQVLRGGAYSDGASILCQQELQQSLAQSPLAPGAGEYLFVDCHRVKPKG